MLEPHLLLGELTGGAKYSRCQNNVPVFTRRTIVQRCNRSYKTAIERHSVKRTTAVPFY